MPEMKGDGYWTLEGACEYFDCDIKRLRGWIHRNDHGDPIGNNAGNWVYPFSLERFLALQVKLLAERQSSRESGNAAK